MMREIRTSGSMSGVEETGWWQTSVSRGAKASLRCWPRSAVPVPRSPPTLQAVWLDGHLIAVIKLSAQVLLEEVSARCRRGVASAASVSLAAGNKHAAVSEENRGVKFPRSAHCGTRRECSGRRIVKLGAA